MRDLGGEDLCRGQARPQPTQWRFATDPGAAECASCPRVREWRGGDCAASAAIKEWHEWLLFLVGLW